MKRAGISFAILSLLLCPFVLWGETIEGCVSRNIKGSSSLQYSVSGVGTYYLTLKWDRSSSLEDDNNFVLFPGRLTDPAADEIFVKNREMQGELGHYEDGEEAFVYNPNIVPGMHIYSASPLRGRAVKISATNNTPPTSLYPHTNRLTIQAIPVVKGKWLLDKAVIKRVDNGGSTEAASVSASIQIPFDKSYDGLYVVCVGNFIRPDGVVTGDCNYAKFYIFDSDVTAVTQDASDEVGEDDGTEIPWRYILPLAGITLIGTGIATRKKKNKNSKNNDENNDEIEEDEPHSIFKMIVWKEVGNSLVYGDPPVKVGARIEETTADGIVVQRPDLSKQIRISPSRNVSLSRPGFDGNYSYAMVAVAPTLANEVPEDAAVTFNFVSPQGRFLNTIVFQVIDAPAILVEPEISFAAGQGKTLFMEFRLWGAATNPDGLEVTMDDRGYQHFSAELEQSNDDPDVFRINLTEHGEATELPGTLESYTCTIRVKPGGDRPEVAESFKINRIHLGMRVELRALKGFLVELESTPNHDILPPIGNKRRLKPAESRVDMQLIVVDDSDPQNEGRIGPVFPDKDPVFTFEDDFEGSMLFTEKQGDYVPTLGDFVQYEHFFFRDFEGKNVPSPCELLKFRYQFRGGMPDGSFYGVIVPTGGFLVPPNRSFAKVTVTMTWHGQEFKQELRVPVNSQPYREVEVPPGGDVMRAYARYDNEDLRREEQLTDLRRKIVMDTRFAELRPLFYKLTVMLEGHDKVFGFDDRDYENIMKIFKQYASGEIGTYFAVKQSVSPEDENFDAVMSTIAAMDRSIPVIICRIGLGIVTGGASEIVLTPLSALAEMKEYVDNGGDSVWGGFAQVSVKIIAMELLFAGVGKGFSKIKQWRAARADKLRQLGSRTKQIGASTQKAAHNAKINATLAERPPFSSGPSADKIGKAGQKVKDTLKGAKELADDAIDGVRKNADTLVSGSKSKLRQEAAKVAREDAQKILDEFKRVMNNPTATQEEMRRATLALQGNKTAQNLLRNSPSDLLRANFNAQMQQMYNELDPKVLKRLTEKLKARGVDMNKYELQVFNGATGNDGELLRLGKKIGADRDVTFQIRDKAGGKWTDLSEQLMEDAYSEAFNEMQYKFIPADRLERMKTLLKADQAVVNGKYGLESYGDDLTRIIDKAHQTEKLVDPDRIAQTYVHKCQEWMQQGMKAHETAEQLLKYGYKEEALHVLGYGEALIEEGVRQNVKQFNRILMPRIEAAAAKGAKLDYTSLMAKIRILEGLGNPPPAGVKSVSLEEARTILATRFGATLDTVVEECAQAIKDVNKVL